MAKKARKKMEEDATAAFEFPAFDEAGFLWKEKEISVATGFAGLFAVLLGVVCWVASTVAGISWEIVFPVGILGVVASAYGIREMRPNSDAYTMGDWAGLIALEFFGWMALWFLLINISPTGL